MSALAGFDVDELRQPSRPTPAWLDPAVAPPVWPFGDITPATATAVLDFLDTHALPLGAGEVLQGLKTWTRSVLPDLHVLARSCAARRDSDEGRVTREMVIGCCRLGADDARRHGVPVGSRAYSVAVVQTEGAGRWVSAPFWSYGRNLASVLADRGGLALNAETGQPQTGWERASPGPTSVGLAELSHALRRLYDTRR